MSKRDLLKPSDSRSANQGEKAPLEHPKAKHQVLDAKLAANRRRKAMNKAAKRRK